MSFYTSVARYGSSILYRGYDSYGKRVYKKDSFSPVFYTRTQKETGCNLMHIIQAVICHD